MVDFHSHVLPGMDDGADSVETALEMLRESREQGVSLICATPHFYADEESPAAFLARREEAWRRLRAAMSPSEPWPEIRLGAEVLYFPGISVAEELRALTLEGTPLLLIEPPMMPWSESMLEEIEDCGSRLRSVPVVAHVDRYMRALEDDSLLGRVAGRRMLAQVNASFFLYRRCREQAIEALEENRFHFIGTDCHDLDERRPNMAEAAEAVRAAGAETPFRLLHERVRRALTLRAGAV